MSPFPRNLTSVELDATSKVRRLFQRNWIRWVRGVVFGLFLVVVLLLVAGVMYQSAGAASDARAYPPPGQLVDVGDYHLHLHCIGAGSPTVVLETLSGGTSASWGWIQPEIARTTRVCAYDRAGRGWSDAGVLPQDLWGTVADLHMLLRNAGEPGPYVLVGHSIGGLYVRAFADRYPDEVAGIVLIDASHPEQLDRYPEYAEEADAYLQMSATFPILVRLGLFRLYFATGNELDFQDLPPRQHAELAAFWSSPDYLQSQRAESLAAPTIFAQARELASLGDLPLTIISAGVTQPSWVTLQTELSLLSTNSIHLTIPDATHVSLAFDRDHAHQTAAAIVQVVETVRVRQSL